MGRKYSVFMFDNEASIKGAIKCLKENRIHIHDVCTPYPVHHLHTLLGKERSKIPYIGFCVGGFVGMFFLFFQSWSLSYYWPHNIGGKPLNSFLTFVPIVFETVILSATLNMVGAFFYSNGLYFKFKTKVFHDRATDDLLCLIVENVNLASDHSYINSLLIKYSPVQVLEKDEGLL